MNEWLNEESGCRTNDAKMKGNERKNFSTIHSSHNFWNMNHRHCLIGKTLLLTFLLPSSNRRLLYHRLVPACIRHLERPIERERDRRFSCWFGKHFPLQLPFHLFQSCFKDWKDAHKKVNESKIVTFWRLQIAFLVVSPFYYNHISFPLPRKVGTINWGVSYNSWILTSTSVCKGMNCAFLTESGTSII